MNDYADFFAHMKAANFALIGILGDDLADDDREIIEDAVADLMGIITGVSKVHDHQSAKHDDSKM